MEFPALYEQKMKALLGQEEYLRYVQTFSHPARQGLRVNTLKISAGEYEERRRRRGEEPLRQVPWCPVGYYFNSETSAYSKNPDYLAGLYYLQEPSAMAPACTLPVEPGNYVLDLCAAPGGKSTMLSCRLKGRGVLISNDISASRAQALVKNLELFGSWSGAVLSEPPYRLVQRFPQRFDAVLVDAPCSGEGMFHKEPAIMKNWEQYGSEYYARLQKEILEAAYIMLRPGGYLLYSTCTFSPLEDEQMAAGFLSRHEDMHLSPIEKVGGMEDGHPEWASDYPREISGQMKNTARFWPQKVEGQGHFEALFQKEGTPQEDKEFISLTGIGGYSAQDLELFQNFCTETFSRPWQEILPSQAVLEKLGTHLYLSPIPQGSLSGLRVLRCGLLLGELKKGRFEPSQALAMFLSKGCCRREADYPAEAEELVRYLKGETLAWDGEDGWVLVMDEGYPLGWAKAVHGALKNKYAKGWILR